MKMGRRPRCSSVTSRTSLRAAEANQTATNLKLVRDAPLMPVRLGPPCRRPILIATIYLLFRGQDTSCGALFPPGQSYVGEAPRFAWFSKSKAGRLLYH